MGVRAGPLVALVLAGLLALVAVRPAEAQSAAPRFTQGDELVQLDFRDVELAVVVETIAKITGKNFIYDDRVRGRVTIVSPQEVSVDQAYAVFESVLKIKGFTAVPGPGGVLKIVPVRDAKESSINTIRDDRPSPNRDNFVTRLVPLLYIDAEAITNTIKPLVSKDASMVSYPPTNTIILTDTEANIRRLMTILDAIDVESYKEELAVIKVKHAEAATLAEQVSEIYGTDPARQTTTAAAARTRRAASSRRQQAAKPSGAARSRVRIITDDRTNSLLVLAARGQVEDIRGLVRQLDVPLIGGGRIHVYYLRHADAEEMAQTLNGMLSGQRAAPRPGRTGAAAAAAPQNIRSQVTALAQGITLNSDAATNSLVIQASKESYEALVAVIEQLDIARPQVLVEALIMEVDITDGIELGLELGYQVVNGDQQFFFTTASAVASGSGTAALAGAAQRAFNLDDSGNPVDPVTGDPVDSGSNIDAVLRAAAKDTNLNIVSAPHILTSDNEEAEIRIGNNIPIITSRVDSATGNTAGLASSVNVERQDIGVTLRVTPQISEGDTLRLKIFQEITDINEDLQSGVGNPEEVGVSLFNRKVENTVVVRDNETVVVGGLISDRWNDSTRKVPFLGDIPGLGWAFKTTGKELRKINLLIFLTPRIIRSADTLELESIRKREEFEKRSGENYQTDAETLERLDKEDGQWAPRSSPALGVLRQQADRYPVERREELEELQRSAEEARVAARLDGGVQGSLYTVRAGVFNDERSATRALKRVLDGGYDATLISGTSGAGLFFELMVGPYEDPSAANQVAELLSQVYGYSPIVSVMPGEAGGDEDGGAPGEEPPQ